MGGSPPPPLCDRLVVAPLAPPPPFGFELFSLAPWGGGWGMRVEVRLRPAALGGLPPLTPALSRPRQRCRFSRGRPAAQGGLTVRFGRAGGAGQAGGGGIPGPRGRERPKGVGDGGVWRSCDTQRWPLRRPSHAGRGGGRGAPVGGPAAASAGAPPRLCIGEGEEQAVVHASEYHSAPPPTPPANPPPLADWGGGGGCHCPSRCFGGARGTVNARNMPSDLVRDGRRSEPLSLCPPDVTPGMLPS